jgi:Lon protease-like protein
MSDQQDPRDEPSGSGGGSDLDPSDLGIVPLFPLPNVVLFPRAVLPLHVFEERYKAMTARALDGDRRVAMALLKSGWEKSYYSRPAIEPVVCVGTILTHEKLPDGKYNFLLQGTTRGRIVQEVGEESYRLARVRSLPELNRDEEALAAERERMLDVFTHGPLGHTAAGRQFARLIKSPLPTPDLADLIAFNFLDDVPLKQSLLAETDVCRRVARALEALDDVRPQVQSASVRTFRNPGVN